MKQTLESRIAKLFSMSDETWKRHANPLSVWTRFTVLPLIVLAIWSRVWIGHWAWGMTAIAIVWAWVNPRLFPTPRSTHNWASKAVLGERVWMNRRRIPVPKYHRLAPNLLSGLSGLGLPFLICGLWQLNVWSTVIGTVLVYVGKIWFLDRMVWLYEDMKESTAEYSRWLYNENAEQAHAEPTSEPVRCAAPEEADV